MGASVTVKEIIALESKVEVAVDAPETANGIVEDTVEGRSDVLLDVARIVVVGDVDDLEESVLLRYAVRCNSSWRRHSNRETRCGRRGWVRTGTCRVTG